MAAVPLRTAATGSLLPRLLPSTMFWATRMQLYVRQFALPFALPAVPVAGWQIGLPGSVKELLQDIWEGILKAVPKKKTSHMKKRHRQMAGKALKDVTSLCKCPACGELKRMHYLCPHCANSKEYGDFVSGGLG